MCAKQKSLHDKFRDFCFAQFFSRNRNHYFFDFFVFFVFFATLFTGFFATFFAFFTGFFATFFAFLAFFFAAILFIPFYLPLD